MIGYCAEYAFIRVKRLVFQTVVVGLVALAFSFAICYAQTIERKQRSELGKVAEETIVYGEITDYTGRRTEGLKIIGSVDLFKPQGLLGEFVKDLGIKRTVRFDTDDRTAGLFIGKREDLRITAISRAEAADALRYELGAEIVWFDGYDKEIFAGSEFLCLVPENVGKYLEPDENGGFVVSLTLIDYDVREKLEIPIELTVAGTYSGGGQSVFFPWRTMENVFNEADAWRLIYSESLRFTISENSRIDEFKERAYNYLKVADPWDSSNSPYLALAVYDESYYDALSNGENAIVVTRRFITAILAASLVLGFVIGFLRARVRRTELCVLNVIGMSGGKLLISAQFELMFVFVPFGIIGVLACQLSGSAWFMLKDALLALVCLLIYSVGNFVTIAVMLRLNSAEILKGREIE